MKSSWWHMSEDACPSSHPPPSNTHNLPLFTFCSLILTLSLSSFIHACMHVCACACAFTHGLMYIRMSRALIHCVASVASHNWGHVGIVMPCFLLPYVIEAAHNGQLSRIMYFFDIHSCDFKTHASYSLATTNNCSKHLTISTARRRIHIPEVALLHTIICQGPWSNTPGWLYLDKPWHTASMSRGHMSPSLCILYAQKEDTHKVLKDASSNARIEDRP